jgi:hypothetical protein
MRQEIHAQSGGALQESLGAFFKQVTRHVLAPLDGFDQVFRADGGLARSSRAKKQGTRATIQTAAEQLIELGAAAGGETAMARRGRAHHREARVQFDAASLDEKIMTAIGKLHSAHFRYMDLAARYAVFARFTFHAYHTMRNALKLLFAFAGREIVENENGAFPACEKLLEREDFPAITDGSLGQDFQFRYGIEGHTGGIDTLHFNAYPLQRFAQLDIGGMENGVVRFLSQPSGNTVKLQQMEILQGLAMRSRDIVQLFERFRKRDVKALLTFSSAFEKELQR